jgi:hypothetical protein
MVTARTKSVALLGGIFLTGVVVGASAILGGEVYVIRSVAKKIAGPAEGVSEMVMGRLSKKLGLTREQQQAIRPIVDARVVIFRQKRNGCASEMSGVVREGIGEVMPYLTDRQRGILTSRWNHFAGKLGNYASLDVGQIDGAQLGSSGAMEKPPESSRQAPP